MFVLHGTARRANVPKARPYMGYLHTYFFAGVYPASRRVLGAL